jgi:hypothetical protein
VASNFDAQFHSFEAELRKLEAEYNMFFAGQLPRPPWETRAAVEQAAKRLDKAVSGEGTYADRFRLQTMQARFATFVDLWDRGLRAREEGRPGPFESRRAARRAEPAPEPADRVVYVTSFRDPMDELDRLHELYERLNTVREDIGEKKVPFHRFAALVRDQVDSIKKRGAPEVAFRVAVQDGKIAFTARGLVGFSDE